MAGEEAQRILGRSQRWPPCAKRTTTLGHLLVGLGKPITSSPRKIRGPIRMALPFGFHYPCRLVFRTGGPGLLTTSRHNDFELYRPVRRRGLTL